MLWLAKFLVLDKVMWRVIHDLEPDVAIDEAEAGLFGALSLDGTRRARHPGPGAPGPGSVAPDVSHVAATVGSAMWRPWRSAAAPQVAVGAGHDAGLHQQRPGEVDGVVALAAAGFGQVTRLLDQLVADTHEIEPVQQVTQVGDRAGTGPASGGGHGGRRPARPRPPPPERHRRQLLGNGPQAPGLVVPGSSMRILMRTDAST